MDVKILKEKIKSLGEILVKFGAEGLPPAEPVKLAEVKLKDGTVMVCDPKMEVGATCTLKLPEGDKPAPDGDYETEDGTICTVKGGKCESILTPETVMSEQLKKQSEVIKKVQEENVALKSQVEEIKTQSVKFISQIAESKEINLKMLEIITELAKEPSTQGTDLVKNVFFKKDRSGINNLINSLPKVKSN